MSTILDRIVENRREEVNSLKKIFSLDEIKRKTDSGYATHSLKKALTADGASGIIAEFKRRSPSKGIINDKHSPADVTKGYINGGASGISVLTEEKYFGGCGVDLSAVREANPLVPILRKDFIVDKYQIYEARMLKADVILLIAAVLNRETISEFTSIAHDLGMEVLLELHDESDLDKIEQSVDLLGINNRNLKDFSVDIDRSLRLMEKLPRQSIKISESGISSPETVITLHNNGFRGFLMGENFMKTNNPGESCRDFILKLRL